MSGACKEKKWIYKFLPFQVLNLDGTKLQGHYVTHRFKEACRAVFKWLSKVITWLQLIRLVIGLKDSRQFFNQWKAKPKPKPIAPCTHDFSRASSEFQVIARNSDCFMVLFVPVVIGQSDYFGFGFSTVIWKPLYLNLQLNWTRTCEHNNTKWSIITNIATHRWCPYLVLSLFKPTVYIRLPSKVSVVSKHHPTTTDSSRWGNSKIFHLEQQRHLGRNNQRDVETPRK